MRIQVLLQKTRSGILTVTWISKMHCRPPTPARNLNKRSKINNLLVHTFENMRIQMQQQKRNSNCTRDKKDALSTHQNTQAPRHRRRKTSRFFLGSSARQCEQSHYCNSTYGFFQSHSVPPFQDSFDFWFSSSFRTWCTTFMQWCTLLKRYDWMVMLTGNERWEVLTWWRENNSIQEVSLPLAVFYFWISYQYLL